MEGGCHAQGLLSSSDSKFGIQHQQWESNNAIEILGKSSGPDIYGWSHCGVNNANITDSSRIAAMEQLQPNHSSTMSDKEELLPAFKKILKLDESNKSDSKSSPDRKGAELGLREWRGIVSKTRPQRIRKSAKPRLRCGQCNATFPRNYESKRHQDTVHNGVEINCSAYGCTRATKPFRRVDKFNEHMKTHGTIQLFVCPIKHCDSGPLSRQGVHSHLLTQHEMTTYRQQHLDVVLKTLHLRQTPLSNGTMRLDAYDACPLAFLGCTFSGSQDDIWDHLEVHELVERSQGYEAIVAYHGSWKKWGKAFCSLCQKHIQLTRDEYGAHIIDFMLHLHHHSKEDRKFHAKELFQVLRPFLKKGEAMCGKEAEFDIIRQDIEQAGMMEA